MHPTRAHILPQGPSLTMTKLSVRFRTSRSAPRPAVPAPTMITSTAPIEVPFNSNLAGGAPQGRARVLGDGIAVPHQHHAQIDTLRHRSQPNSDAVAIGDL